MGGKLKAALFGPRELVRLPVTLIETSGGMATRLVAPPIDGVLSAADDGGLTFSSSPHAARMEFAGHGAVSFVAAEPAQHDALVVAPHERAELGGRVGWIGEKRDNLAASIEIVLLYTGPDDRAVVRLRDTRGWIGALSENSYGKEDMIWDIFAFARAVERTRAAAGLIPLQFKGVLNETSWRYRYC